jgi:two-component system cell cycle response regulator CtrA
MHPGETTGPVGFWNEAGKMLDATATVQRLLADMRTAAIGRNFGHYDRLSEELEQFTQPYLSPAQPVNWLEHNLTPSQTVIADLLLSKMGKVVPRTSVLNALYFNKIEEAEPKIVDVFICNLRKRLTKSGFSIETIWGRGFRMVERNTGPSSIKTSSGAHRYEAAA